MLLPSSCSIGVMHREHDRPSCLLHILSHGTTILICAWKICGLQQLPNLADGSEFRYQEWTSILYVSALGAEAGFGCVQVWEQSTRAQILKVDPYLPHRPQASGPDGDYEDALAAEMGRVHNMLVAVRGSLYLQLNRDFKAAVAHVFAQLRQPGFSSNAVAFVHANLPRPPRVSVFVQVKLGNSLLPSALLPTGDAWK